MAEVRVDQQDLLAALCGGDGEVDRHGGLPVARRGAGDHDGGLLLRGAGEGEHGADLPEGLGDEAGWPEAFAEAVARQDESALVEMVKEARS